MSELRRVVIYTDGACIGNPGPGGYAAILISGDNRRELSGGRRLTTNNRMEILAAIVALEALKCPCHVTLYSDSRYVVDTITMGWAQRWKGNGWKRNRTDYAVNTDLWKRLLDLCEKHQVEFAWVQGHAGQAENERCDYLSDLAARSTDLPADVKYEELQSQQRSLFE